MAIISELKSNDDKKIERILESNLIKYNETENDYERRHYKIIIDEIYGFERTRAASCCSQLPNSKGFAYFIKYYKEFENSLHYFANKMSDEILFKDNDIEELAHKKYNSLDEFEEAGPSAFMLDTIEEFDEDLADYLKVNILESDFLNTFISIVTSNWKGYDLIEKDKMKSMFSRLSDTYDGMTKDKVCNYAKSEILIYLSIKYDRIKEFKENYKMEDTTDEELNTLIENNPVDEENCSEHDKKIIERMSILFEKYKKHRDVMKTITKIYSE